ncbi:MAG: Lrp/AsnC family transcriptional regulator [Candidatus Bathyarchaeia archaeon]
MSRPIDYLDREIIAILQRDGRTTNTEMARQLGVAEGTIRRRMDRLIDEGVVKIAAVTEPYKVGMGVVALINLDVELPSLEEVAEKLVQMQCVRVVAYTTGSHDILVEALFPSQEDLLEFLKDKLGRIPGIRKTQTSIVLRLLKRSYEWELPRVEQLEELEVSLDERR